MVDVHCHVDLYPNPIDVVNECERLGIYTIAVTNLPSHFAKGFAHLRSCKKVRLALGMHPLYADRHEGEMNLFKQLVNQTSYIGEIGLDFSKEGVKTKEKQMKSFDFVLSQIGQKNKILSLHSREAEKEVLTRLLHFKIKAAIFHWYTGPLDLVDEIVKAGYMFSINPAMTKSDFGKAIIKKIPLTHLLTESDGPFIMFKGRLIRPADLSVVYEYIADAQNVKKATVEEIVDGNFKRIINTILS